MDGQGQRHGSGAVCIEGTGGLLHGVDGPGTGGGDDGHTVAVPRQLLGRGGDSRVVERLVGGGDGPVLDGAETAGERPGQDRLGVEVRDLPADPHCKVVEPLPCEDVDGADAVPH